MTRRTPDPKGPAADRHSAATSHVCLLLARLLEQAARTHWRGFQHATSHGDTETAQLLERRARRYETLADLAHAYAWEPAIRVPEGTPKLNGEDFDRLVSRQVPVTIASNARRRRSERQRTHAYGLTALEREALTVASAPVGLRNETLNRSAWSLARLVCDGLLDADDVIEVLAAAARDAGLHEREARPTIRGALRKRGAAA